MHPDAIGALLVFLLAGSFVTPADAPPIPVDAPPLPADAPPIPVHALRPSLSSTPSSVPGVSLPGVGDLVINELQVRPPPSGSEFIELFNRSGVVFDLAGCTIRDARSAPSPLTDGSLEVAPGGYVVLVEDGPAFARQFPGTPHLVPARWPSLNNGGDTVFLERNGSLIDSVSYTGAMVKDNRSLERIDPGAPPSQHNFAASIDPDGATPHRQNSRYAPDEAGPDLLFVEEVADRELDLHFDEPIRFDPILGNSIVLGRQSPVDAWTTVPHVLRASFAGPLDGTYVEVGYVYDRLGNRSTDLRAPVSWRPEPMDVVVNEILYEPLADDMDGLPDQVEYIELMNRSNRRVHLDGLARTRNPDEHGHADTIRVAHRHLALDPGNYLLLAADTMQTADTAQAAGTAGTSGTIRTDHDMRVEARVVVLPSLGLRNVGDRVRLHARDGVLLDDLHYTPHWHHPDVLETRGIALERIYVHGASNDAQNWTSSIDPSGGTPGQSNSVYLRSRLAPESRGMHVAPNPFSPDRDGIDDVVRITCRFSSTLARVRLLIFDTAGVMVRELVQARLAAGSAEFLWDGLDDHQRRLRTGIYVALAQVYDSRNEVTESLKAPIVLARRY